MSANQKKIRYGVPYDCMQNLRDTTSLSCKRRKLGHCLSDALASIRPFQIRHITAGTSCFFLRTFLAPSHVLRQPMTTHYTQSIHSTQSAFTMPLSALACHNSVASVTCSRRALRVSVKYYNVLLIGHWRWRSSYGPLFGLSAYVSHSGLLSVLSQGLATRSDSTLLI